MGSGKKVVLRGEGICKNFGALVALSEVSLQLTQGEILGVIGPNGSGKTTLFNVLTGILAADQGEVYFEGKRISGTPTYKICRLGLIKTAQIVQPFSGMSVLDNVIIGSLYGQNLSLSKARQKSLDILDWVGLMSSAQVPAESITVAMRRRLELARALATGPKIILLDENMAGLTPSEIEGVLTLLREINARGISLIVVEHIMQAVMGICHRIFVLNYGQKIAEGLPEEVVRNREVIEAYLGEDYA
ncbi:MAG: ABC transporter ATP-binding protein [Pseudomonadota bacterium]